jgi:hypothetical protein
MKDIKKNKQCLCIPVLGVYMIETIELVSDPFVSVLTGKHTSEYRRD